MINRLITILLIYSTRFMTGVPLIAITGVIATICFFAYFLFLGVFSPVFKQTPVLCFSFFAGTFFAGYRLGDGSVRGGALAGGLIGLFLLYATVTKGESLGKYSANEMVFILITPFLGATGDWAGQRFRKWRNS